jgi:hypothetical protein
VSKEVFVMPGKYDVGSVGRSAVLLENALDEETSAGEGESKHAAANSSLDKSRLVASSQVTSRRIAFALSATLLFLFLFATTTRQVFVDKQDPIE